MEGEALRDGKDRVRQNLITPLVKAGMVRKRGVTQASEDEMLANLEARLAYMTEANLKALAEVVTTYASGKHHNNWPAEVSIYNWARRIQLPPASESRLVRSYLQSAAGRAALNGGYLVELFMHLKKWGAPPNDFSMSEIKRKASENQGARDRIKREQASGRASQRDLDWVASYFQALERCEGVIAAKSEDAAA